MFNINATDYYLKKGFRNFKKGKLLKAREYYIKALSEEPDDILILNNLAQVNNLLGDIAKAKGYSEIILKKCNEELSHEKTEETLLAKLNALLTLEKMFEVNETIDELLEINPNNIIGLMHKAQYLELNKQPQEALKYIEKILKHDENNIPLLLSKGRNLAELNEFEKSEECYNQVFKLDYKNRTAMYLKSQLLQKKYNMNITPHGLMLRAMKFWDTNEPDLADYQLKKALELDSRYDEIWFLRGTVLMFLDDIDEARKCFKKAFEINPNSGGHEKKKVLRTINRVQKINNLFRWKRKK